MLDGSGLITVRVKLGLCMFDGDRHKSIVVEWRGHIQF